MADVVYLKKELEMKLDIVSKEAINVICEYIYGKHYNTLDEYKDAVKDLKKMIEIYINNNECSARELQDIFSNSIKVNSVNDDEKV